jgi:acetate kinase
MTPALLTLNTGSSSIKFRLFGLSDSLPFLLGGKVTGIGDTPVFQVHEEEQSRDETHQLPQNSTHASALAHVLDWLLSHQDGWQLAAAAHRIVHGGPRFSAPMRLDEDAVVYLKTLCPLAPLHQPHNLLAVEALWHHHPDLPQYGCFDTAFHAQHDAIRSAYAVPESVQKKGVRRYGFHGLSYAWIAHRLQHDHPALAVGRVVAAHLGNGASLCAMKNGQSVDTTMGMTALDGLPMGTRCGSIDAGAVIYMQRELGLNVDALEKLLYNESGLKGLSGISNDVKTLSESDDPRATAALDYFVWKCTQHIAAMATTLGGMDTLVFTGGIGENAADIRTRILQGLAFMPAFETLIIPANEERSMAGSIHEQFYKEA